MELRGQIRSSSRRARWVAMAAAAGVLAAVFSAPSPRANGSRLGQVVRGFPSPGDYPEGLAWDGTHLWCNNFTNGTLYKIDPVTGATLASHQYVWLPSRPEGLAWDGEHLWTCDWQTGVISKLLEGSDGVVRVAKKFNKPAGAGPTVGLGWDGTHVWLTCWPTQPRFERSQLYQCDPETFAVVKMFELPVYWAEDLAWDGRWFWCADWHAGIGFAIEPATGDTLHTFRTPGTKPVGTAWDGTWLWMSDTTRDSIWAVDISAARSTPVEKSSWTDLKQRFR